DVTLKMPAFEWVHVQLHQQKGMISLSPPTICNSAHFITFRFKFFCMFISFSRCLLKTLQKIFPHGFKLLLLSIKRLLQGCLLFLISFFMALLQIVGGDKLIIPFC
ncbi:hypothetical protein ODR03_24655, partial [Escherichia coli]|nr:hypothetical protein [Escherichia coli]